MRNLPKLLWNKGLQKNVRSEEVLGFVRDGFEASVDRWFYDSFSFLSEGLRRSFLEGISVRVMYGLTVWTSWGIQAADVVLRPDWAELAGMDTEVRC